MHIGTALKPTSLWRTETNHEHGDGLAKDGVEEIERRAGGHNEEVTGEQVLATTVVEQRILQTTEQTLERILHNSPSHASAAATSITSQWG